MKILITGGSGLLGQYLNITLAEEHDILTCYNNNEGNCKSFANAEVDIRNYEKLRDIFVQFKPGVVVHAAGVTTANQADELGVKLTNEINVTAAKNIAELCKKYDAKIIYTSTDLVYAGYRGSMLDENAKLIPASLYAESKLMGEIKIQQTFDNYIILRTALLYGFGLNNSTSHFEEMYKKLKAGKKVKLFSDQYRTPLSLIDAARIIGKLVDLPIQKEIINFGGKERVSRLELGEKFCDIAGLDKSLIEQISMDDIPGMPQVADVSMNTEKLQSFGIRQQSVNEAIQEMLVSRH